MYRCPKCKNEYNREGFCTSDGTKLILCERDIALFSADTAIKRNLISEIVAVIFNILMIVAYFVIYRQLENYRFANNPENLLIGFSLLLISVIAIKYFVKRFYLVTRIAAVLINLFVFIHTAKGFIRLSSFSNTYFFTYWVIELAALIILLIILRFVLKQKCRTGGNQ